MSQRAKILHLKYLRKLASVSYTHLDVYKRQILIYLNNLNIVIVELANYLPIPCMAKAKQPLQEIVIFD